MLWLRPKLSCLSFGLVVLAGAFCIPARAQHSPELIRQGRVERPGHPRPRIFLPEQRHIDVRESTQFAPARSKPTAPPTTVATDGAENQKERRLSLDEAIRVALANSDVIRVLAGVTATSTGQSIYSVAITNTGIDREQARFDPAVSSEHGFNRIEPPVAVLDPFDPAGARITGTQTQDYDMRTGVTKTTMSGGTAAFNVNSNSARFAPGVFPLNPRDRYSLDLSYTQPLYRGGGIRANRAPIVIARLNAERSFFEYKDGMQQLVRSVIAAYWALVFARTDEWARQQQVDQAEFAYEQALGRFKAGTASRGVVAQTRVSLGNFRTALTAAKNNVLLREGALRNVMGLPPADSYRIVPVTPPSDQSLQFDWDELIALGETFRPDLTQLKLVLEADYQQLLINRNEAHPNVDALMLYRWNGLDGRTPTGETLTTQGGQFTDWTLGVTFSVPLSLRRERAALRRQELIIAQDQAFLRQGIHNMTHNLAISLRNLEQFFQQYQEFHAIREDAELNLQERSARWRTGGVGGLSYLEVLQAITDWGNTISAEAQSLTNYNTELANLELETGTILQSHGIFFFEERHRNIGPLGHLGRGRQYPSSTPPTPNGERYGTGDEPAEEFFDLEAPLPQRPLPVPEDLPRPPGRQREGLQP